MDHSRRSQVFRPKSGAPSPAQDASPGSGSGASHSDRMDAILEVLRRGERFLVCSHARPDGDAVGSMLAMGMFIEQLGKHADMVMADRVPDIYQGLPGAEGIRVAQIAHGPYDAVILLECDSLERTGVSGLDCTTFVQARRLRFVPVFTTSQSVYSCYDQLAPAGPAPTTVTTLPLQPGVPGR